MVKKKKTAKEYRESSRNRVAEYKKRMIENGYKALTIYISKELQEALQEIKDAHGVNNNDALDIIFQGYKKSFKKSPTVSDLQECSSNLQHKKSDEYKKQLVERIKKYKQEHNTYAQIAEILNNDGIEPITRDQWTAEGLKSFWLRNKG